MVVVLLGAGLLIAATGTPPDDEPKSSPTSTSPAAMYADNVRPWATLIYDAKNFFAATEAQAVDRPGGYALGNDAALVARRVGFSSPDSELASYKGTKTTAIYCLVAPTGEFYATHITGLGGGATEGSTTFGLNSECSLTEGVAHVENEYTTGSEVLKVVEETYWEVRDERVVPFEKVQQVRDGKTKTVASAAEYVALAVATYADDVNGGELPRSFGAAELAVLEGTLPKGVQIGYYDPRVKYGYRVCVTNGREEALFEATRTSGRLLRHTAGTCGLVG